MARASPVAIRPLDLAARHQRHRHGDEGALQGRDACRTARARRRRRRSAASTPARSRRTSSFNLLGEACSSQLVAHDAVVLVDHEDDVALGGERAKTSMSSATPNGPSSRSCAKLSTRIQAARSPCPRTRKVTGMRRRKLRRSPRSRCPSCTRTEARNSRPRSPCRRGCRTRGLAAPRSPSTTTSARSSSMAAMMRCISRKRPENSAASCFGRVGVKASRSSALTRLASGWLGLPRSQGRTGRGEGEGGGLHGRPLGCARGRGRRRGGGGGHWRRGRRRGRDRTAVGDAEGGSAVALGRGFAPLARRHRGRHDGGRARGRRRVHAARPVAPGDLGPHGEGARVNGTASSGSRAGSAAARRAARSRAA